jgi:uncharacterized protein (DUF3084 family)
MISGYAWILPAVIAVGRVLSWWRARWTRWAVPATGVVVSVLVFVTGFHVSSPPLGPDSGRTRGAPRRTNRTDRLEHRRW